MKNVVMMIVSGMVGVLALGFLMTVCGNMNRYVETQSILPSAMEKTVEQMVLQDGAGYGEGEAVAVCLESIAAAVDRDSDILVSIYKEDVKKGVLAMKIIEPFRYPNGRIGTVECDRTVIYNRLQRSEDEDCLVRFYRSREAMLKEENCYKTYVVKEGERLLSPAEPTGEEAVFVGWRDVNDYIADFSLPVERDLIYYAEWE